MRGAVVAHSSCFGICPVLAFVHIPPTIGKVGTTSEIRAEVRRRRIDKISRVKIISPWIVIDACFCWGRSRREGGCLRWCGRGRRLSCGGCCWHSRYCRLYLRDSCRLGRQHGGNRAMCRGCWQCLITDGSPDRRPPLFLVVWTCHTCRDDQHDEGKCYEPFHRR